MSNDKEYNWKRGSSKVSERTIRNSTVKQREFSSLDSQTKNRLRNQK